MVPALSEDSHARGSYTALGTFSGAIGWNGLTIIVVPPVTGVTYAMTGKHEERGSWLGCLCGGYFSLSYSLCINRMFRN